MSDLTRFRDHCRQMAGPPVAPGCPAASDRALWLRLADEVDRYLAGDSEVVQTRGMHDVALPWEVELTDGAPESQGTANG